MRTTSRSASIWRRSLALAAAYLLVLQMVVVGLTLGVHAAPQAAPGGILCVASDPHAAPGETDAPAPKPGFPPCCMQGCSLLGGLGVPPSGPAAGTRVGHARVLVLRPADHEPSKPGEDGFHTHARGPPRAA